MVNVMQYVSIASASSATAAFQMQNENIKM